MIYQRKRATQKGKRQEYSYCPMIWVKDPDGRRRQHWGGSFRTKAEARAEERRLLLERDRGADFRRTQLTVDEVFQQYVREKRNKVKPSTFVRSQELLNLLAALIGSRQLAQLRPAQISEAYNHLLKESLEANRAPLPLAAARRAGPRGQLGPGRSQCSRPR